MSRTVPTRPPVSPRLLNFGCGSAFHQEWINLDVAPETPGVIAHDVRGGLPFPAQSFDAAYGSHVLEHLEPDTALRLIRECHRVLRPGGIVRIVVPDLEAIAKLYLESLERAAGGDADAVFRYDWAMLELYDQTTRSFPGGMMAACLSRKLEERHASFVESRIGTELTRPQDSGRPLPRFDPRRAVRALRIAGVRLRRRTAQILAFLLLGAEGAAALREGLFRRSGEVHLWMYDRFSLKRALEQAGFIDVHTCQADDSRIPDFGRFGLETLNRRPRKPDSLYVEGAKALGRSA